MSCLSCSTLLGGFCFVAIILWITVIVSTLYSKNFIIFVVHYIYLQKQMYPSNYIHAIWWIHKWIFDIQLDAFFLKVLSGEKTVHNMQSCVSRGHGMCFILLFMLQMLVLILYTYMYRCVLSCYSFNDINVWILKVVFDVKN